MVRKFGVGRNKMEFFSDSLFSEAENPIRVLMLLVESEAEIGNQGKNPFAFQRQWTTTTPSTSVDFIAHLRDQQIDSKLERMQAEMKAQVDSSMRSYMEQFMTAQQQMLQALGTAAAGNRATEEDEPLGTAGPLKLAKQLLKETFIVTNGDELKNINIPRMTRLHKRKDALATIALTTVTDPTHYGVARLSGTRILEFVEKTKQDEAPSNLINAGFYILEPEIIEMIPDGFAMLEKDVFPKLAKEGSLRGFPFAGQWFDIGTLESYELAKKKWLGVSYNE
jgi:UTP-glucose-1-phosphate uridylyltransferase